MIKVKIEASNKAGVKSESGCNIPIKLRFTCLIPKNSLFEDLGKVIYTVEKSGVNIDTHSVYNDCAEELRCLDLDSLSVRYKKIYSVLDTPYSIDISVKRP